MCGICGVVTTGITPEPALLRKMIGQLRHRGPDGSGYLRDRRAALGHARLAIIDKDGGAQPLANEDNTVWVSFNGEIFNYLELRDELKLLGHCFRTASDTEVIVHAWEQWGPGSFERFNGQWALALWDTRAERLVLSRDRLGVRPLYYARRPDRLVFASEVKAIFADESIPRELDPHGLDQVLTYWSTVAPRTVFHGIEQVPPGHYAVLDADGFRSICYWAADFPDRGGEPFQDVRENAERLRALIVEASRLRFVRSDVPVGAYMSGGIDSAVTAAVLSHYTDSPLHTFSLRFSDDEFDEGRYQREMVSRLGTQHVDVMVTPADIAEVFPEVIRHAETPILRAAPAPLFLLSKLVRESGYKVVVTGEGADEVLGGYDIYREARVRLFWARDEKSSKRSRAAELLYPWMGRSPGAAPAFARGFFGLHLDPDDPAISHRPRWNSTAAIKSLLVKEWQGELRAADPAGLVATMPHAQEKWDSLSRAQWLEMTTLLPGYILASQGDRMLMANSVEGRFPFLDPNVVGFADALPARHKLFGLDEKYLLKMAFGDLVPKSIQYRPKQPYRAPDAACFVSENAPEWVKDVTTPTALRDVGVFDARQVEGLFRKCRRNQGRTLSNTDNMRVLAILSTQLLQHELTSVLAATSPAEPTTVTDLLDQGGRSD